jgi:hypothetical protein
MVSPDANEIINLMEQTLNEFMFKYHRPPIEIRVGITIKVLLDLNLNGELDEFCGIPVHTYVELKYNQIQAVG